MRSLARERLVASRPAECGVEPAGLQRVQQRLRLERTAARLGPDQERLRALGNRLGIGVDDRRLAPIDAVYRSRNSIISRNLYVVSMCSSGKGIGPG